MRIANLRAPLAFAAVALSATAIAACGSDSGSDTTSTSDTASITATKDDAIAKQVPADIAKTGTLKVASEAGYPPMELIKPGTEDEIVGVDPDLATALGQVMGLKAEVNNVPFDAILGGIAANKYNLGMSSFTDTKEREQEVDFVTYMDVGTAFLEPTSAPAGVTKLADLCGKKVAVQRTTTQEDAAEKQSEECTASGKAKVDVSAYKSQNEANNAVVSGRAQLTMADLFTVLDQAEKSNGKLRKVGESFNKEPYGIAIAKDSGLAEPVLAAMKKLIAGGQYQAILKKWNVEDGAINTPEINGAIN